MTGRIVSGKTIADGMKETIKEQVKIIKRTYGFVPRILSISVGKHPESEVYLKQRDKACNEVGISSIYKELNEDISKKELIEIIEESNSDKMIHGILIQFPLPSGISVEKIINTIDPKKDVEGLSPKNMGNILIGNESLVPCTPLAVIKILEHERLNIQGKHVIIVNHSAVVGKPLAALCLNRNATVSICHVYTKNLQEITSQADVLISAAGVPGLITGNHVKEGACVIDVAVVQTDKGLCGDVKQSEILQKVSFVTPVPGGVGPVTVACALHNMIKTTLCTAEAMK